MEPFSRIVRGAARMTSLTEVYGLTADASKALFEEQGQPANLQAVLAGPQQYWALVGRFWAIGMFWTG